MEQKYPYYLYPVVEEYREASGERKTELARRIAANIGDIITLRTLLGVDPEEFASFYPDIRSSRPSTDDTIDSFIDRFADPAKPRPSEMDELIVPVATYSIEDAYTEDEEEVSVEEQEQDDDTSAMLASFLTKNPPKKNGRKKARTAHEESSPAPARSANMSESLAKVMIKNGNYQKAIEIITDLSLNNPKKSIYFADQIRFLKKLMANSKG